MRQRAAVRGQVSRTDPPPSDGHVVHLAVGCALIVVTVGATFGPVAVLGSSLEDQWPDGLVRGIIVTAIRLWEHWREARGNPHPDDRRIA